MHPKLSAALVTTPAFATLSLADGILVGVPNWPSITVTAHIIAAVVEQNPDLTVALQTATNPVIFEAMGTGSVHIHPEVWLPNQQGLVEQARRWT